MAFALSLLNQVSYSTTGSDETFGTLLFHWFTFSNCTLK